MKQREINSVAVGQIEYVFGFIGYRLIETILAVGHPSIGIVVAPVPTFAPPSPSTRKQQPDMSICLIAGVLWLTLIGTMGAAGLMYIGAKKDPHFTRKMQMRVVLAECLRAKTSPAAGLARAEISERCGRLVQGIQQRVGTVR